MVLSFGHARVEYPALGHFDCRLIQPVVRRVAVLQTRQMVMLGHPDCRLIQPVARRVAVLRTMQMVMHRYLRHDAMLVCVPCRLRAEKVRQKTLMTPRLRRLRAVHVSRSPCPWEGLHAFQISCRAMPLMRCAEVSVAELADPIACLT